MVIDVMDLLLPVMYVRHYNGTVHSDLCLTLKLNLSERKSVHHEQVIRKKSNASEDYHETATSKESNTSEGCHETVTRKELQLKIIMKQL